ncbi:MAG: hypothetical protein ACYCZN_02935 [Candidatus Dormibacteria bacterium]
MDRAVPPMVPAWMVGARLTFGLLLLADAVLEWQPGTYQVFDSIIYSNASVSPEPLRGALVAAAQLVSHQPALANGILAAVETALAVCVLLGLWASAALLVSVPLFLGIWVVGQGAGLPFAQGTTDLNSGIPYLLVAILLWFGHSWERASVWQWVHADSALHSRRAIIGAVSSLLALTLLGFGTWGSVASIERSPGVASPPAVGGAALTFDPRLGVDVLFGGCNALTCSDQTWVWGGHYWRRVSASGGPPAIGYAAAAYDPALSRVMLFGGAGSQGLGAALASTWEWNQGWREPATAAAPSGRRFAAMGYDPLTHQLVLVGGDTSGGRPLSGTWTYHSGTWHQLSVGGSPGALTAAAMAWDARSGTLILYGGSDGAGRLGGTWSWNGTTWTRLHPSRSPGLLAYESMSSDPLNGTVLLYAGAGARQRTWTWTGTDWTPQTSASSPSVFSFESMAPAPDGRGVLLFGGATSQGSGFSAQTWLWSAAGWSRVT